MSTVEMQAADVAPPVKGSAYARPSTATAELIVLPASSEGTGKVRFWTFQAETKDAWVLFGTDNTVVVAPTDVSAIDGSGNLTADVNTGYYIPAGVSVPFRLPAAITHFSHVESATGGYFRFYESTGVGD